MHIECLRHFLTLQKVYDLFVLIHFLTRGSKMVQPGGEAQLRSHLQQSRDQEVPDRFFVGFPWLVDFRSSARSLVITQ